MLLKNPKITGCVVVFFMFYGAAFLAEAQEAGSTIIDKLVDSSKNTGYTHEKRRDYLVRAYEVFQNFEEEQRNPQLLSKISLAFYKLNDSTNFRRFNREARLLSVKFEDSLSLANNYWDLGNFYSRRGVKDSAYWSFSSAQEIFHSVGNDFYSARMLLNMAIMQSDVRDYTGSEITTMEAIKIFKPLKEYRHLFRAYNNLGVNFNGMADYEKSLLHYRNALEYQEKIKTENTYRESTLNNLGVCYEHQEQFSTAIQYYRKALKTSDIKKRNIGLYARLLDNLAYSKFRLKDTLEVRSLFYKALAIRDSIGDLPGQAMNKMHLAELELYKGDTMSALRLAKNVTVLAGKSKNNRELLSALLFISKNDPINFKEYTNRYIALSDRLLKEERATRNKFARIRFETDEFIEANIKLDRQRRAILLVASFILLTGLLLFIIKNQQNKNKELRFERQQQQSNEEIYKLMISQQNKLDEGSRKEKSRISQELHDGVLGRLFGIRLLLGTINAKNDPNSVEQRGKYIDELQAIEEEIRNISHELHRDAEIKNVGYPNFVESLLDTQGKIGKFSASFTNDPEISWEEIDGGIKMNLYRILQEGLQNITKYAKAKKVNLTFFEHNGQLHIQLVDNGIGFDPKSKKNGIGLTNIKSRVTGLDGTIKISSELGEGTTLNLSIPLDRDT